MAAIEDILQELAIDDQISSPATKNAVHPLQMHLIISTIFSYLPVTSLKNCRLVNRFWNSEAVAWIQNNGTNYVDVTAKDFPRFCSDFENAKVLPFVKLGIHLDDLSLEHCSKFFTKHGSEIRSLQIEEGLNEYSFPDDELIMLENLNKLRLVFKNVPNLKILGLDLFYIPITVDDFDEDEQDAESDEGEVGDGNEGDENDEDSEQGFEYYHELLDEDITLPQVEVLEVTSEAMLSELFLKGLFTMLPNVKVIQFKQFGHYEDEYIQGYEDFMEATQILNLQEIHSPFHILQGLWRALGTNNSLQLAKLSMRLGNISDQQKRKYNSPTVWWYNFDVSAAQQQVLNAQSEYLESLSLTFAKVHNSQPFKKLRLPIMKKLRNLVITSDENEACLIVPIEQDQVPKLSTLCLEPELIMARVFADCIFTTVQEVTLANKKPNTDTSEILSKIGGWFPNLKTLRNLEISLNSGTMQTITTKFQNIENLEIKIVDQCGSMTKFNLVVSGISDHNILNQMRDLMSQESLPTSMIDSLGPSFRDLKCLKRLVLSFHANTESFARIDEIGVNLAFLRLSPKLRLTLSGDFSIPDALASKLTAHFQHVVL